MLLALAGVAVAIVGLFADKRKWAAITALSVVVAYVVLVNAYILLVVL